MIGMGRRGCRRLLVRAQRQAPLREGLDDLVDRLLAEVRDGGELALRLGHEVADRLDTGALEAVVAADPELELLDEDVVHRPAAALPAALRKPVAPAGAVVEADRARAGPEILDAVLVGEDREAGDQDLRGLAQRGLRVDRPVRLDVQRELVEVRALADTRLLDAVGDAADRAEDRVDRDHADGLIRRLVLLRRTVATAAADRQVELQLRLLVERRDVRVRVEDLDPGRQIDVARSDLPGSRHDQGRFDLGRIRVHAAHDALEVEDDVRHILGDALDGRELVRDPLDPDRGHSSAREAGEQHAAQRVPECVAEAAVKRLNHELSAVLLNRFGRDPGDLEVEHQFPNFVLVWGSKPWRRRLRGHGGREDYGSLLGVELHDQLLLHRRGDLRALGAAEHLRGELVVVGLQPGGHLRHELRRVADHVLGVRAGLERDHVVLAHLVARDVHTAAVDGPVTVADQLAGLAPAGGETEPDQHVVEAALEHAQQVLARDSGLPRRLVVVDPELLLEDAVVATRLLLLTQLHAVLGLLLTPATVVAGRVRTTLDAALVGEAALALEEQLLALAAALLALGGCIACHESSLDPAPLTRAAAVVCLRSDVLDARDL